MTTPEQGPSASSFETTPDGETVVAFSALPDIEIPDFEDIEPLTQLEVLRDVVRTATYFQMRLGLRSELVEGGSVLYGPSLEEPGTTDVHLSGDDEPDDAVMWVIDRQSLDAQLAFLNDAYPPRDPTVTWEDVVGRLAEEAAAAGYDLSPLDDWEI